MKNTENSGKEDKKPDEEKKEFTPVRISPSTVVIGILLVIVVAMVLRGDNVKSPECPKCSECETCTGKLSGSLSALYLYPEKCKDCNLSMVKQLSNDLGLDIGIFLSRDVSRPSVLVANKDKSYLGIANSRFNIANILCGVANYTKACVVIDDELAKAKSCLNEYKINPENVVFYYTSDLCENCDLMVSWVKELEKESYNFTGIDMNNTMQMTVAKQCLNQLIDVNGYVPQFVCPTTGQTHIGKFDFYDDLKEFADKCRS